MAARAAEAGPTDARGPWVLVEDGAVLLQLHADTLLPLQRQALPAPVGAHAASADGRWLCTVEGSTLQLRDARLQALRHWPLPAPVAWLADAPRRRAFVLALAPRAELWQLSYDEQAEDFYDGLVHDYRFGEGVPTRAFHNVRRLSLPEPLLDASFDAEQAELAGRGWVFNLDARRRVRLQPLLDPPGPGRGAPCTVQGRPGLAMPVRGVARLDLYRCDDWERMASWALPAPADAVLSHPQVDALVLRVGAALLLLHPAHDGVQALPGIDPLHGGSRWRDDGRVLWLLTDEALLALDTRRWQVLRRQPLPRPVSVC